MSIKEEQKSTLASLHFWRRNQMVARREHDTPEVENSDKAIRVLFERADAQAIPFKLQNTVMHHAEHNRDEGFSDMNINDKEKDQGINKEGHELRVTSLESQQIRDSDEVARIIMTNGITGKDHTFSVWAGDIENNELEPYYVYLNNPQDLQGDDLSVEDSLSNALYDSSLIEIVKDSEGIQQSIQDYYHDEGKTFSFDIPVSQQNLDLHTMIVDEEVADLLMKIEKNMLTKEDVVDFGKLVEHDTSTKYDLASYLQDSIEVVLKENGIEKDEVNHVNSALQALSIESDITNFSKNKSVDKANEEQELKF
ncbi:hypothetical protein [Sporosarcina sp. G11-34]|uniref:hypothetical protein n=1 Tax=Sporosarcina sp. G11-34 TaxID=2849605 RepID=UPI0022A9E41D|nr:hypothetical protein [Sporosarcina sp. G11-34]MCZ2260761.1 hypothetical protein [Sporosarcina sp. G11-34]